MEIILPVIACGILLVVLPIAYAYFTLSKSGEIALSVFLKHINLYIGLILGALLLLGVHYYLEYFAHAQLFKDNGTVFLAEAVLVLFFGNCSGLPRMHANGRESVERPRQRLGQNSRSLASIRGRPPE